MKKAFVHPPAGTSKKAIRNAHFELRKETSEEDLELDTTVALLLKEGNLQERSGEVFERLIRTQTAVGTELAQSRENLATLETATIAQHATQLADIEQNDEVRVFDPYGNVLCNVECKNFASRPRSISDKTLSQMQVRASGDVLQFEGLVRDRIEHVAKRHVEAELDRLALDVRRLGMEHARLERKAEDALDVEAARRANNEPLADAVGAVPSTSAQALFVAAEHFRSAVLEPTRLQFVDSLLRFYPGATRFEPFT